MTNVLSGGISLNKFSVCHPEVFNTCINKYTMIYQSNTTKFYCVYYCVRAKCFDSYRIIFRHFKHCQVTICVLERSEDDSIRIKTCCPNTIINITMIFFLCLTDTSMYMYVCIPNQPCLPSKSGCYLYNQTSLVV
jgi:hypothetical protein